MNCIDCANANCESASVCDMEVNNCEAYVPSSNFVLLKEMYRIEDFAAFFRIYLNVAYAKRAVMDAQSMMVLAKKHG